MPSDTLALHHNIAVLNSQSTNVLCSLSADVAQRSDVIYSPCSFSQYSHFRCGLVVASLFSMTYDGVIVTSPVLEPYELTRFSNEPTYTFFCQQFQNHMNLQGSQTRVKHNSPKYQFQNHMNLQGSQTLKRRQR